MVPHIKRTLCVLKPQCVKLENAGHFDPQWNIFNFLYIMNQFETSSGADLLSQK